MKDAIQQTYPHGWFVAIADEQSVGDAATFRQLVDRLRALGKDPRETLVVEAGINYPEQVTIVY
jgi:hypothetical protein